MRDSVHILAGIALLAACGLAWAGEAAGPKSGVLFCVGKPDGLAAEFGLTRERYAGYLKVFPKPIVYTVGQSNPTDWPHIHPSTNDGWAGRRVHPFTIQFTLERPADQPLYLIIGTADAHGGERSQVAVAANGKEIGAQLAPTGNGAACENPAAWAEPASLVFPIPQGALAPGPNSIAISLRGGSWIIYDYVLLGTRPEPPKITVESETLLDEALAGPMRGVEEVVFAVRQPGRDGHWYANFGYYAADDRQLLYGPGGRLCRLNLRSGQVSVLLDDPKGGIRDPQVHYDAKKILFSYRKGDSRYHNLYEINADGACGGQTLSRLHEAVSAEHGSEPPQGKAPASGGLRQLTDGPWDDVEPTYLPDGNIAFVSSRCERWVNCWLTHVGVLYRCDADGRNLRPISSNNEHDNTPAVLPDGRILYTRWEYVDRSQVDYHHLWVVNPDGTGQMVYYGNQRPGTVMIDTVPIPGTDRVASIFSPGHGQREHDGVLTIVDPRAGPDARPFARPISRGAHFRDPWAFSEDCFLLSDGTRLLVMNGRGATRTVYTLPESDRRAGLQVHEPRPLIARPRERAIPPRVDLASTTGRLILVNVNIGRNMRGVRPGEIRRLLVLETLPKPINYTGGMEPLSYGGTFTLERILGTVPVEPDGSAYFEVPALRSLFFVALDENGLSVRRMQSFVTVQPGETTSCIGCHESRTATPPAGAAAAWGAEAPKNGGIADYGPLKVRNQAPSQNLPSANPEVIHSRTATPPAEGAAAWGAEAPKNGGITDFGPLKVRNQTPAQERPLPSPNGQMTRTAPSAILALRRPPSRIEPIPDAPQIFDFARDVQPVLDRHCVPCHDYAKTARGGPRAGGLILTGDHGSMFSHSYFTLSARRLVADGRNMARSNYPPRAIGSAASPLLKMTDGSHHDVKVSEADRKLIRLWIDSGAPYPGTYAALGTGMIGGYAANGLDRSDTKWPSMQAAQAVLKQRCAPCHVGPLALPDSPSDDQGMPPWAIAYGSPKLRFSRHILYNLSRPEKSLLLLAPLAEAAGGYGICKSLTAEGRAKLPLSRDGRARLLPSRDGGASPPANEKTAQPELRPPSPPAGAGGKTARQGPRPPEPIFASAANPDYQKLLASIRDTAKKLDEIKRFDMPGFVPRAAYVREMKRYGILPADADPAKPIDPYRLEEAYWRSLWYRPSPR